MQPSDDAQTTEATTHGSDRPTYGTRADYLEINGGTSAPARIEPRDDGVEGGPELLDRLHGVYDPSPGARADRDTDS